MPLRSLFISSVAFAPWLALSAHAEPIDASGASSLPVMELTVPSDDADMLPADDILAEELAPPPPPQAYNASLQTIAGEHPSRTLNARRPDIDLRFDLSATDKVEDISVTLSLDPLPGVDPELPLTVSFNGGPKTRIDPNGQGMDTTVVLDPRRVRATGNILTLAFAASCENPVGGYRLDLDRSSLNLMARPDVGDPQLRHIENRLAGPVFSPRKVGLLASGPDSTKLQALAAQAIALRTSSTPDFDTQLDGTDFELLMMTRTDLASHSEELDILLGTGPAIVLSKTQPNRIMLTGDTPEEVMQAVSAFASASLPDSRRAGTTPEEVLSQTPLDVDRHIINGVANLDLLSVSTGPLRIHKFDVTDPAVTDGQLVLRLKRDEQTPSGTRLKVTLNDVTLGDARVRGRRRTVSYPIPQGLLVGTDNQLTLTTQEVPQTPQCGASEPFIAIGSGSELLLSAENETLPTDLSRFTATGSLFGHDDGADTVLILPESETDFLAALPIVAKLAKASGKGWTQASFARGDTNVADRHRLIIEPERDIEEKYRLSAPRALQAAWRGVDALKISDSSIQQYANLDGNDTIRQFARSAATAYPSPFDGVAAIYPSQSGKLIGIISNVAGTGFADAMEPLSQANHWNSLVGGVARWNESDIDIAQAALPLTIRVEAENLPEAVQMPSVTGLSSRLATVGDQIPKLDLERPDAGQLGDWIDQKWTYFSETVRKHDVTVAVTKATASDISDPLNQIETQITELNSTLQRHLGTPEQSMGSARLGQAQILPGMVMVILTFLAGLIGLAFASPLRHRKET